MGSHIAPDHLRGEHHFTPAEYDTKWRWSAAGILLGCGLLLGIIVFIVSH